MCQLYRHWGANEELLYVGISISTANRLSQHKGSSNWFSLIENVTIENFQTRDLALKAEKYAIINEKPIYNKTHNKICDNTISQSNLACRKLNIAMLNINKPTSNKKVKCMESKKMVNAHDLRVALLATIEGVLDGRVDVAQANAVASLSTELHKSISQEWDMRVYANKNLTLDSGEVVKILEG